MATHKSDLDRLEEIIHYVVKMKYFYINLSKNCYRFRNSDRQD